MEKEISPSKKSKCCALVGDVYNNRIYWVVSLNTADKDIRESLKDYGGTLVSPKGKIYEVPPQYYKEGGWPGKDEGKEHPWQTLQKDMEQEATGKRPEHTHEFSFRVLYTEDPQYIG